MGAASRERSRHAKPEIAAEPFYQAIRRALERP
jgi:hypothetical protein